MGWFSSRDGSKSKVSKTSSGGMRYERISKPSSGGKHSHSVIKSDPSGATKFFFRGPNSSGGSKKN